VRFVVHAGAPQSIEHYLQESGRAGRDGLEADCVLIYSGADFLKWRLMLERSGELTPAAKTLLREMERYAAGVGCRHRHLAAYVGEAFERDDCGACDTCLGELESVPDAVVLARKILSCVARVGQRFGTGHVTAVLRGLPSEAVLARGHDRLSTFGLLSDRPAPEIKGYVEQLTSLGLLSQTDDGFPVLRVSSDGVRLLRDETSRPGLALARQKRPEKEGTPRRSRVEAESWEGVDRDLFERLRAVRLRIARSRGVPPYVIFHDTTLRELARLRPASLDELKHVYGVGERKADDLGQEFLDAIVAP